MFKIFTLLLVFINFTLIVTSITNAISFGTILIGKRDDHHDNGFKMQMKNILMRCEMVTPTFLTQNKYSHLRNHLCLVSLVQSLMHVKRQRDQLDDYFTFRQGWRSFFLLLLRWCWFKIFVLCVWSNLVPDTEVDFLPGSKNSRPRIAVYIYLFKNFNSNNK